HKEQRVRHEHLSALMLDQGGVRAWLGARASYTERLQNVILSAVLTHHLKARDEAAIAECPPTVNARVRLLVDYPDYRDLMTLPGRRLAWPGVTPRLPSLWSFDQQPGAQHIPSLRSLLGTRLYQFERQLKAERPLRRLNRAVRAALIAADAAASGLVR